MRAICETCSQPQPAAWRAGDLCVQCGAAVRVDVRCFWCAKWTPQSGGARYCRSCGGELVPASQYGAARMLKDAGADRFTVPKLLKELDPAQIENFTRIYQRQAVIVAKHVDDVRFLEQFLFQKNYSVVLEEELIPQLPWPEAALAKMAVPAEPRALPQHAQDADVPPVSDAVMQVRAIEAASPFSQSRALAALARIRLEDWAGLRAAQQAFASAPAGSPLRLEAALTLTSWKVGAQVGYLREDRELLAALEDPAAERQFPLETAVRKARNRETDPEIAREALTAADPETAFAAALVLGDTDRLQAALTRTPLERAGAGRRLILDGHYHGLPAALAAGPIEVQMELVEALRRVKGPLPALAETLMKLYESTGNDRLRVRLAEVLCRDLNPDWASRICALAGDEQYIYQALLSEAAVLPPQSVAGVARQMIARGRFRMSQYGLPEAAQRGVLPDDFVPAEFSAAPEETQRELLRCAEEQLKERGDETLHRFVLNAVFGPHSAEVRAAAWWALSRWYASEKYAWKGPFCLSPSEVERFFGSIAVFLPRFTAVLNDQATMKEVGLYDFVADLLKYRSDDFPAALAADPALVGIVSEWVQALLHAVASDYYAFVRQNAAEMLGRLGLYPPWRDTVLAGLEQYLADDSFDLKYICTRAVKKIKGEPLD